MREAVFCKPLADRLSFRIEIDNPPRHIDFIAKNKLDEKTGKLKKTRHYLTGNLFYSDNLHFTIRTRIVTDVKKFLSPYFMLQNIPFLTNVKLSLICMRHDDNFDLDNWESFWKKVILDLLKTPTDRMKLRAKKYKSELIHLNIIPDDRVKHVKHFETRFVQRGNMMVIILDGDKVVTQSEITFDQKTAF